MRCIEAADLKARLSLQLGDPTIDHALCAGDECGIGRQREGRYRLHFLRLSNRPEFRSGRWQFDAGRSSNKALKKAAINASSIDLRAFMKPSPRLCCVP